ncbi:MAG: nickel pincer cofactor biosynthesis protein LarC [Chloroflexota bacterium]|nr:MAG: nickel pincer cofactor biosynthesis protein LarC [Chloroflexota bacterium]
MLLGALIDVGLPIEELRAGLATLPLTGYTISANTVKRRMISATKVMVDLADGQPSRGPREVAALIQSSELPEPVKETAQMIFARLAQAEATIHGLPIEQIHFHEVGAVDAIVDIVGAAYGLHHLGIDSVHCSPLNVGHGFVRTSHGVLPIPAPATVRLLEGVPVYDSGIEAELVTPTGAAIVSTIARSFGTLPPMRVTASGYGAGGKDLQQPNVLRIMLGDEALSRADDAPVLVLETNIDDMNPELYEHVADRLFDRGAMDVFLIPIHMKKNRPAVLLSAIAPPELADELIRIILDETTSLGVRFTEMRRRCLARETESVQTIYGTIRVKVARRAGFLTAAPEHDDCRRAAREHGVPLARVYAAAQQAWSAGEKGRET